MKIVYTGEKDTRLFKEALGQTIGRLLEEDPDVLYLDADLMSCIGTAKLPGKTDRAIDCGIAEANMVGIACGAASVGFKPIVHSFGPFASRRCYDQVFLSGAYAGKAGLEKFSVSAPAVAPLKERIRTLDLPEVRKTPGAAE